MKGIESDLLDAPADAPAALSFLIFNHRLKRLL